MNLKRLAKQALLIEGFCMMLGMTGCITSLVGGGLAGGGIVSGALIKMGQALERYEPLSYKMTVNGLLLFSTGLMTCGAAIALAQNAGLTVSPDEVKELFNEVNNQEEPEKRLRTYTDWETFQIVKQQCIGCALYRMEGKCAKHGEIKMNCSDFTKVNQCHSCKYYSLTSPTIKCAVHPELPIDCNDFDPS